MPIKFVASANPLELGRVLVSRYLELGKRNGLYVYSVAQLTIEQAVSGFIAN
jgi:hypothetical protein